MLKVLHFCLIIISFFPLISITIKEETVKNDDIIFSFKYQYEPEQKDITIFCNLTNHSKNPIYVGKYRNNEWNKKISISDKDSAYTFCPNIKLDKIMWAHYIMRMYELKPKKSIFFFIEVHIDSTNYQNISKKLYKDEIAYYLYDKGLANFYDSTKLELIPIKNRDNDFGLFTLYSNLYRSIPIVFQFD